MGVFVIYTVAYIIVSPHFQFSSNKNIGNVALFSSQTSHLGSVLNIFINPEDSEAAAPSARAGGAVCPGGFRSPRQAPSVPLVRPCGRGALTGHLFFKTHSALLVFCSVLFF